MADKDQVIVGTAGHIDHGKTALVKALTGVDADRLPEEKQRGITIELGFVFLEDPSGDKQIVFIDVPGHEKLVRTMVAGAGHLDAALLVVAADEGVQAQTREHFDILRLLGIPVGLVALTKADLVDETRLQAVRSQVQALVAGSFLEGAPVLPVSAVTGQGLPELRAALRSLTAQVRPRPDSGVLRMPLDRVFTMHGFGTVVAGTILSGTVSVGDRVEILPERLSAKVRGVQIHGKPVTQSRLGQRTALNLQGVDKDQLHRGQVAAAPGSLQTTQRMDAQLELLPGHGADLRNRTRARLHIGTDEVLTRLVLLDREALAPGESALVQFLLERETVAAPGDRFVLRSFSPLRTLGGGTVLDPHPQRHKRFDAELVTELQEAATSREAAVEHVFRKQPDRPLSMAEVAVALDLPVAEVESLMNDLAAAGKLVGITAAGTGGRPGAFLLAADLEQHAARMWQLVEAYFAEHPHHLLLPLASLRTAFTRRAAAPIFEAALAAEIQRGRLFRQGSNLGVVGREAQLSPQDRAALERVESAFREGGFAPASPAEVAARLGLGPAALDKLLKSLYDAGRLVRLSENVTYHAESLRAAQAVVAEEIQRRGNLTVAEFRDRLGVSRKYALALLEYLDGIGCTRRQGDARVLR